MRIFVAYINSTVEARVFVMHSEHSALLACDRLKAVAQAANPVAGNSVCSRAACNSGADFNP